MKFADEILQKAKAAESAAALVLAAEEAGSLFAELHKTGELSDEDLASVSGGWGEPEEKHRFHPGDKVRFQRLPGDAPQCGILECFSHYAGDGEKMYSITMADENFTAQAIPFLVRESFIEMA